MRYFELVGMSQDSRIQSSPEKPSENLFFLFKETKNFAGTDCSHSFDSGGYSSQNQSFDEVQYGMWQAGPCF